MKIELEFPDHWEDEVISYLKESLEDIVVFYADARDDVRADIWRSLAAQCERRDGG